MAKKSPIWKTKFGSIEIAAWEKETEKFGKQISFSINKSWQDKDGNWQNSTFYFSSTTEMFNVIQAIQEALDFKYHKSNVEKDTTGGKSNKAENDNKVDDSGGI